jgi:peptidoglycan hydrolase-like protein with peptidoglycan-binding domain
VKLLQHLLAERGFFPADKINGNFGALTGDAVLSYQIERGIVADARSDGAGSVGPETLQALRNEEEMEAYKLVRAEGWKAL